MSKLRVYQLIKGLGRGGAEMLLLEMQRSCPEGVTYSFGYLLPHKDALVTLLRAEEASVDLFPLRSTLAIPRVAWRLARRLRTWRADVVHAHLPVSGLVGRLAGRLARVPVVYTEHNLQERYHPVTRWANRVSWSLQEHVLAVSNDVAESARRSSGRRVPISVLLNGVPVERLRRDPERRAVVRQELAVGDSTLVIGTVAVFRKQKRLDLWLEVAKQIADSRKDVVFLLVGDGPLRDQLQQRARELCLADETSEGPLRWVGLRENPSDYLAAMDLYMMSSEFEGLPLALLEAMALELPVVATSVGGIPEVVDHGLSGELVAPGDSDGLVRACERFLDRPDLRSAYGGAGRERVERDFSMRRMSAELHAVYREVADHALRR